MSVGMESTQDELRVGPSDSCGCKFSSTEKLRRVPADLHITFKGQRAQPRLPADPLISNAKVPPGRWQMMLRQDNGWVLLGQGADP